MDARQKQGKVKEQSRMIPEHIQREVLRLRKEERLTKRQIAEKLPISRSSITTIICRGFVVSGSKRWLRPVTPAAMKRHLGICPKCERKVVMPCLACMTPRRPRPEWADHVGKICFDLEPDDEVRRLEIIARHKIQ